MAVGFISPCAKDGPGSYQHRLVYLEAHGSGALCDLVTLNMACVLSQEADPR